MNSSFNLNTFLDEQNSYMNMKFTAAENAEAEMEKREIERAKDAVTSEGFLGITLGEKMKELGIGERVVQQVLNTATGLVTDIVDPLNDYLKEYEDIFDEEKFNQKLQEFGKQMYFSKQELAKQASAGPYIVGLTKELNDASNSTGTNFSMEM